MNVDTAKQKKKEQTVRERNKIKLQSQGRFATTQGSEAVDHDVVRRERIDKLKQYQQTSSGTSPVQGEAIRLVGDGGDP